MNTLLKILKFNTRFIPSNRAFHVTPVSNLYAPSALGIDGYLQSRKRIKEQLTGFSEKFRTKMDEFVKDGKNMIFTEDLKNMVHIAEPTDLQLIVEMIKKYNSQKSEFRFGSYIFGPVVMRMFHFLDAPNEALSCFEDPNNDGFFDQLVSFQVLLDLLYNNEMYDEMYRVFAKVQEKQLNMTKYPKYAVVLILAACYKQNTAESFQFASKMWSDMLTTGMSPLRRAAALFAALAIKQGEPHIALESIAMQKQQYVTIRNIKVTALAGMGRAEDTLPLLRSVLDIDQPDQKDKHTFFEETIKAVKDVIEKSNNRDLQKEFENIETALRDRQLIENKTVEQLLLAEITMVKKDQQSFQRKRLPYAHRQRYPNYK